MKQRIAIASVFILLAIAALWAFRDESAHEVDLDGHAQSKGDVDSRSEHQLETANDAGAIGVTSAAEATTSNEVDAAATDESSALPRVPRALQMTH